MSTYYHGSPVIFDKFNLDSLGEGSGCKFGVGVYLTESFETAAHYSEPRYGSADHHYVYTVEVPQKTEDNCLPFYGVPIPSGIIARVEAKLGESLPDLIKGPGRIPDGKGGTEGVSVGKYLRKYIAHRLSGVAKEKLVKESQIDDRTRRRFKRLVDGVEGVSVGKTARRQPRIQTYSEPAELEEV